MPSKLKRLNTAKTYVILDTAVLQYDQLLAVLRIIVKAGVDIVQLRDKQGLAKDMVLFCQQAKRITQQRTLLIMNDRVDVAVAAGVDGVHIGQEDLSLQDVKRLVSKHMLIGLSCQNLLQARRAKVLGAHYIGFGSVFKTKTKPERIPMDLKLLQKVHKEIKIPIFAIGGINRNNVKNILSFGVKRVAVCREVLLAKKPDQVVSDFRQILS